MVFGSWGQLGVDLFIIISVYFLQRNNRFRTAKVIDLVLETMFYGLLWALVSIYFLHIDLNVMQVVKSVLSLLFGTYWFATAYVLMYIFSPAINELLKKCLPSYLKRISVLLLLFVSGYKTLYKTAPVCDFLFFICIYILIFTIEHTDWTELVHRKCGKWFLYCTFFLLGIHIVLLSIGQLKKSNFIISHSYYLNLRGSVFILLDSICLFYYFRRKRYEFSSNAINIVASTCFGVFLSHQGYGYRFWNAMLTKDFGTGLIASLYMIFAVIVIFIGCSAVDLVRKYTIGILVNKCLSIPRVSNCLRKLDSYMNGNDK